VADVLVVPARQLRNPVTFVVLVETADLSLQLIGLLPAK
jgi:hypothetical protein